MKEYFYTSLGILRKTEMKNQDFIDVYLDLIMRRGGTSHRPAISILKKTQVYAQFKEV